MSIVQDEMNRRSSNHYRDETVRLTLENQQLRERFAFAAREIHPFERDCATGQHKLGLPYYGVQTGGGRTRLICAECYAYCADIRDIRRER